LRGWPSALRALSAARDISSSVAAACSGFIGSRRLRASSSAAIFGANGSRLDACSTHFCSRASSRSS
jgi:hypothetical protein